MSDWPEVEARLRRIIDGLTAGGRGYAWISSPGVVADLLAAPARIEALTPPAGWVLVPIEPVTDQLRALLIHRGYDPDAKEEALDKLGQLDVATMGVFISAYKAMVAAAPAPPSLAPKEPT